MAFLNVGIVPAIDGAEGAFASDPALKFFSHLLGEGLFNRIGASTQKEGADDRKSDGKGLQARRILKKVMGDK